MECLHLHLESVEASLPDLVGLVAEALYEGLWVLSLDYGGQESLLAGTGALMAVVDDQASDDEGTHLLTEQVKHQLLVCHDKDST